jgi:hypothetical protein
MKKNTLSPFIAQFVISLLFYIVVPIILLTIGLEVKVSNAAALMVIIGYVFYFFVIFLPGVYTIFDVLIKNYETGKMMYNHSYIESSWFPARNYKASAGYRKYKGWNYHLKVLFAGQKGNSLFSMVFFHTMEKGNHYTVTYAKKSKIVLSIMSEQGEEMMQFDVD